MPKRTLNYFYLGTLSYGKAWQLQKLVHALCVEEQLAPSVLLLEHPPVLTLGKHASRGHLLISEQALQAEGIELVQTDRGGEVTAHMPGQLVAYPILKLAQFKMGLRSYIFSLEQSIIEVLKKHGVSGQRDKEHPGVWVGRDKICALGVRIRQRVSMHGLALNVCNRTDLFSKIIPCGIKDRGVTTLSTLTNRLLNPQIVAKQFAEELASSLGAQTWQWGDRQALSEALRGQKDLFEKGFHADSFFS